MNTLKRFWRWLREDYEIAANVMVCIGQWHLLFLAVEFEIVNCTGAVLIGHIRNLDDDNEIDGWWEGFALLGYEQSVDEITFHLLYFRFTRARSD